MTRETSSGHPAVPSGGSKRGHLVGYARVSTPDQDVAAQVDQLQAAGVGKVWTETASGATRARPVLEQVLNQVLRRGDTLVVVRLDRLGRSLRHLLEVVAFLDEHGIGLRSLHESIDTTTPAGRLVYSIFGAVAEFERDLIRERTLAGLTAAKTRGRTGGRPKTLTDDHDEQIARLHAEGRPVAEIARVLRVSRATVYRHLPEGARPDSYRPKEPT